jgi:hypothetical protein
MMVWREDFWAMKYSFFDTQDLLKRGDYTVNNFSYFKIILHPNAIPRQLRYRVIPAHKMLAFALLLS